ncbi:LysM peptidoglycan-binding domain-containing protein [Hydrogenothermus marinus]|uniref:Membrane-bound lytic murein transglycosylase D n=1 Tax=Hydrogenothermus marinus TaxID=133270 RepID=A0A3M0BK44_9AQUI|nr:LysM peptidoglycan-binding domain-containing protein [Hydrogenothermus marinus]RMA97547.1 membrane-bound lytic murein transglycosylase D [Hydrogenothermus marinus]
MMKKIKYLVFSIFFILNTAFADEDLNNISFLVKFAVENSPVVQNFYSKGKLNIHLTLPEKLETKNRIYLLKRNKYAIEKYLDRGREYIPIIKSIFNKHGLPDDLVFLPIIESHFNIKAKSPAGAAGLWQFMPQTARMYGLKINKWIDERYDLIKSTEAAAYYLKDLYSIFNDWGLALASYNSGEGNIIRKINKYGGINFWDIRNYLSPETRNYVPSFLATLTVVKEILKNNENQKINFDVIQVDKPISLDLISTLLKVPYSKLKDLNPHLLKGKTPPDDGVYNIYLPKGYGNTLKVVLEDIQLDKYKALKEYKVKRGDTLGKIAKKFKTTISYLKKINHLKNDYVIANTYIKVPTTIEAYPLYSYSVVDTTEDIQYTEKGIIYKVKRGDTLGKIARKFRVSVSSLKKWNHIKSYILPNQKIVIYKKVFNKNLQRKAMLHRVSYLKKKVKKRKPKFKYIFYKVKKGDSLGKIAKKFKVRISDIKKWNKLSSNIIRVNERLTIIKRVIER